MALSESELRQFHDKGYVVQAGLIPRDWMDRLDEEIESLHERMAQAPAEGVGIAWEDDQPADRPRRIRQLMNSEIVSPTIDRITRSERVLSVMAQLIGPEVILYHSKLLMKAAHDGTFTPWHQDWGYWHQWINDPTQINCMLAIDRADESNGAIRFVEGSHRPGLREHITVKSNSFSIALEGDLDAYDGKLIEMDPGDCVFFGPLVIHGSGPNTSDHDRRANTAAFDKPHNFKSQPFKAERMRLGAPVG